MHVVDDVEVGVGVGCSGAAGLLGAGAAASIGGASAGGGIHAAWRVTAATRPGRQVSALTPVPGRGSRRSTSGVIGRLTKYEHSRARRLWVRAPPRQAAQEATGAAAGGEASERARTWVWLWLV